MPRDGVTAERAAPGTLRDNGPGLGAQRGRHAVAEQIAPVPDSGLEFAASVGKEKF